MTRVIRCLSRFDFWRNIKIFVLDSFVPRNSPRCRICLWRAPSIQIIRSILSWFGVSGTLACRSVLHCKSMVLESSTKKFLIRITVKLIQWIVFRCIVWCSGSRCPLRCFDTLKDSFWVLFLMCSLWRICSSDVGHFLDIWTRLSP